MEVTGTPGEIYEQHMIPAIFARWAPDLVAVVGLRPGERVLDVACGTGVVTRLLPHRVGPTGRVVGLDINPDMLAALQEMRRVLVPVGRLVLSIWRSVAHAPAYRVLEEALARRIGAAQAALPPFSCGDAQAIRALVTRAGFREVRVRADVKFSRWQSAEHMVQSVVRSGPTMLGALAAQGPDVLDAIVAEVTNATRDYVDDEGWAASQATNIITAVV